MLQRRLRVRGVVQGVGFRPHVWRLARDEALDGWVRNDAEGVEILLQGEAPYSIERFTERLRAEAPPRARIDALESSDETPRDLQQGFAILRQPGRRRAHHDRRRQQPYAPPAWRRCSIRRARRWRYAFTNCTHCGPRYTITRAVPYDRAQTSMAGFALCPACAREYGDPADRRFHAEPIACPECGPSLRWLDSAGRDLPCGRSAGRRRGRAARRAPSSRSRGWAASTWPAMRAMPQSVQRLRQRKQREAKPFALMLANLHSVEKLAYVDDASRALLLSPAHPIVLLPRTTGRRGRPARHCRRHATPGRDAALHAAALPAVPRIRRSSRRHGLDRATSNHRPW